MRVPPSTSTSGRWRPQQVRACRVVVVGNAVDGDGPPGDELRQARRNGLTVDPREELLAFLVAHRRHLLDDDVWNEAAVQEDPQHLPAVRVFLKYEKRKTKAHGCLGVLAALSEARG